MKLHEIIHPSLSHSSKHQSITQYDREDEIYEQESSVNGDAYGTWKKICITGIRDVVFQCKDKTGHTQSYKIVYSSSCCFFLSYKYEMNLCDNKT